ncbi:MAG: YcaO-like family protein [Desulforhabdus sp.]|nr:YcaO-like family protein [Desulforhabdus sp.]
MGTEQHPMHYELRLISTSSGIGYFACCPKENLGSDVALAYLRAHPHDEFMHKHVLDRVTERTVEHLGQMIEEAQGDPVFLAILCEAVLTNQKFSRLRNRFAEGELERLSKQTPLIYIKSNMLKDRLLHVQWIDLLRRNLFEHASLSDLLHKRLPLPFAGALSPTAEGRAHVRQIQRQMAAPGPSSEKPVCPPEETARKALERLQAIGVIASAELKHKSSLSPFGFLRKWRLSLSVFHGKHNYTLKGIQTSYGRGLLEASARASYAMEMVERCSSFCSFDSAGALGFIRDYPLIHASHGDLKDQKLNALDPNSLNLEVPYANELLYWMEAEQGGGSTSAPILIPAQCVFLFCNLDEISLFSGLGSTGLASGNSMTQAKASALLEVIERDSEAVTPYEPSRCFKLRADDPVVTALLADYHARGVHVQFQDISPENGVPAYKCFVVGPQGQIIKGTGAHLDGKKALLSAMTETPYPFPNGPASTPTPKDLPTVYFEDLPDYSTGAPAGDLAVLERVLELNGYQPIYINLTRKDIGIPVVKAIVPGLELMADFDQFSRVSPRLLSRIQEIGS